MFLAYLHTLGEARTVDQWSPQAYAVLVPPPTTQPWTSLGGSASCLHPPTASLKLWRESSSYFPHWSVWPMSAPMQLSTVLPAVSKRPSHKTCTLSVLSAWTGSHRPSSCALRLPPARFPWRLPCSWAAPSLPWPCSRGSPWHCQIPWRMLPWQLMRILCLWSVSALCILLRPPPGASGGESSSPGCSWSSLYFFGLVYCSCFSQCMQVCQNIMCYKTYVTPCM